MTKLFLLQRIVKTIGGGWGCLYIPYAFGIEMMIWEKTVSANFGEVWWAAGPKA
jgi:K+ transporter